MKKVVLLLNNPKFFLSHRIPLAKKAVEQGYDLTVVVPEMEGIELIREKGFKVKSYLLNRKSVNPFKEILSIASLYRVLNDLRPDILHSFTIKPVIYGSIIGQIAGLPSVINTITGLGYVFLKKGLKGRLLRGIVGFLYRMAFRGKNIKVVFQNRDDQDLFINAGYIERKKTFIIRGSGVSTAKFTKLPERNTKPIILLPSRLLWDKGVADLIDASRILKNQSVDFELILAGPNNEGNPTDIPKEVIANWEEKGLCKWIGPQTDMPKLYSEAHIVCLPSYREGLPLSLLEASACGRAVVTTDVPGCRDVVKDGFNGYLVPTSNPAKLAQALKKLISDQNLRNLFGQNGRQLVLENFSEQIILSQYMDLYSKFSKTDTPAHIKAS